MQTIRVRCFCCKRYFKKNTSEYNRTQRLGRRHFCSRHCSVITGNRELSRGDASRFGTDHSPKTDEHSPFRWFMRAVRRRREKGTTDLSVEYLKELWDRQGGRCPYTGDPITLPLTTDEWGAGSKWCRASLDRIDNSKGYIKGNVRFVSLIANLARWKFSDEELLAFCRAVTLSAGQNLFKEAPTNVFTTGSDKNA